MSTSFSIVIPAHNEGGELAETLRSLDVAARMCQQMLPALARPEVVVVDDGSSDETVAIAQSFGAAVVRTHGRVGAGAARNLGAAASSGQYLVFIDADVVVSRYALHAIAASIHSPGLVAGAFRAIYRPRKLGSWLVCAFWDWRRMRGGPAQGVGQFYERALFEELGGFDSSLVMGEDADLYGRARKVLAARHDLPPLIVQDAVIWPSTRRYDQWSSIRMALTQNPVSVRVFPRSRTVWKSWHGQPLR